MGPKDVKEWLIGSLQMDCNSLGFLHGKVEQLNRLPNKVRGCLQFLPAFDSLCKCISALSMSSTYELPILYAEVFFAFRTGGGIFRH